MTRADICRLLERIGVIPVIRARSPEIALQVIEAIVAGGINVIEVTMTVPKAVALLREVRKRYGDSITVGAGTVLDPASVTACVDAGAQFVVSPTLNFETIRTTHQLGKVAIPGALTPTEIMAAFNAGAEIVKVFPCSAMGGPSYLKAIRAPMPWARMLPTGGVNLATARDYLDAGAVALGVGSELADSKAVESGDFGLITERAKQFLAIIEEARAEKPPPITNA